MSIVKIDKNFGGKNLMSKKRISKRIISCFVLCALMISSIMGFAINSNAASINSRQRLDGTYVYYVSDESSLRKAINCVQDGDSIEFTNNIFCYGNLGVSKRITIDLRYYYLSFKWASYGLETHRDVTVKNGVIYGSNDSDSAVCIWNGNLKLENMSIFAGDCNSYAYYKGNGIYAYSSYSKIYMDYCYIQGGQNYQNSGIRSGKAVYGGTIISQGRGFVVVNGVCR